MKRQRPTKHLLSLFIVALSFGSAHADEKLKGIACRSVHLWYPAPEATAFYNEVTVEQSADGSYFMVCGFHMGYFGIQELYDGRKVMLFSVWDPGNQNDPNSVKKERKVRVLHHADDVRVKRFGGEGTGGQSFFDFDWKLGDTYRFLVTASKDGERTAFTGWFFLPKEERWKKLVTFSTLAGGGLLKGCYSFVEDFRRNRISATKVRKAQFGAGWVLSTAGEWKPLDTSRFTADRNPVLNIDAGPHKDRFFLATGGDTKNATTELRQTIQAKTADRKVPEDLVRLLRTANQES